MQAGRLNLIIGLLLAAAAFAAFSQVLWNDFLNYDDDDYVVKNTYVNSGLTLRSAAWALTSTHSANWHPLTWLSHMLDVRLYGLKPWGHHLTSLLLHVVSTLLLFSVLAKTTGRTYRSAFVAALFAVHPLHVESVAWAAERKDVLSTLFWMLTIWAYVRYVRSPGIRTYVPVVLFLALGLMSKPMLVTLPFALLLLDYWPLGRTRLTRYSLLVTPSPTGEAGALRSDAEPGNHGGQVRTQPSTTTGTRLVLEKAPLFAMAIASCIITLVAQHRALAVSSLDRVPLADRVQNALVAYITYILKMLWPDNLAIIYPLRGNSLPTWHVVGSAFVLVLVSVLAVRAAKSLPYLAVGWFWYVGTLVPVIGLVQVGAQAMADRYTYIPLIGLFIVIAWGMPDLARCVRTNRRMGEWENGGEGRQPSAASRQQSAIRPSAISHQPSAISHQPSAIGHLPFPKSSILPFAAGVAIAAMMVFTWVQVGYWRNTATLFGHAISVTRDNYLAHATLGAHLVIKGKPEAAAEHLTASLRIRPESAAAHSDLGMALTKLGRFEEAVLHFQEAVRLDSGRPLIHYNLGVALASAGRTREAAEQFSEALRLKPDLEDAQRNLDALRGTQAGGAESEAREHYRRGLDLDMQGRADDAMKEYRKAIRLDPNLAEAHINMGVILKDMGRLDEAIGEYREAIRLDPTLAEAHNNLAIALYFKRDFAGAWEEVKLCRRYGAAPHPDFVEALSQRMAEP